MSGVLKGPGRSPSAPEVAEGLHIANALVTAWNAENLMIPRTLRTTGSTVVGQQAYTVGIGGDFNVARPETIRFATVMISGTIETPLPVIYSDAQQYPEIINKDLATTYPYTVYYERTPGMGTLRVLPTPTSAKPIVLYTPAVWTEFPSEFEVIEMPDGYPEAFELCLAVAIKRRYPDSMADPDLLRAAACAKDKLKAMNVRPQFSEPDPAVRVMDTTRRSGMYRRGFWW